MPGVLMVEAMAQLCGVLCLQAPVSDGKGLFLFAGKKSSPSFPSLLLCIMSHDSNPTGIDGVKFRRPVVPGDTLVMEVELTKFMEKFGVAKLSGKAYVDGQLAVEVKDLTFGLAKQ